MEPIFEVEMFQIALFICMARSFIRLLITNPCPRNRFDYHTPDNSFYSANIDNIDQVLHLTWRVKSVKVLMLVKPLLVKVNYFSQYCRLVFLIY